MRAPAPDYFYIHIANGSPIGSYQQVYISANYLCHSEEFLIKCTVGCG